MSNNNETFLMSDSGKTFEDAVEDYFKTGRCKIEHNGRKYMMVTHLNSTRRSYQRMMNGEFKPVNRIGPKPSDGMFDGKTYLWSSSHPLFPNDISWVKWCVKDGDPRDMINVPFYLFCVKMDRILEITTMTEMNSFGEKYGVSLYGSKSVEIDWTKASKDYDGISIMKYMGDYDIVRNAWYCGWDCDSLVIWRNDTDDPNIVASRQLGTTEKSNMFECMYMIDSPEI